MSGSLLRAVRRARRRTNNAVNNPQPTVPIQVAEASVAGSVLTIVFDAPVTLTGTPKYLTDVAGALPVSAEMTDPMTLAITFSASIAAATEVRIPYEEACVRNASGGFVSTSTFPVGA